MEDRPSRQCGLDCGARRAEVGYRPNYLSHSHLRIIQACLHCSCKKKRYARINNKFYALLFIKYCILSFQFLSDRDGVDLLIVPELLVVAVLQPRITLSDMKRFTISLEAICISVSGAGGLLMYASRRGTIYSGEDDVAFAAYRTSLTYLPMYKTKLLDISNNKAG